MKISIIWFRRDLRLEDNIALDKALGSGLPVLPLFIFDENILNELPADDARVNFIYQTLTSIHDKLAKKGSSLLCKKGDPVNVWKELIKEFDIGNVFTNKDYEPYAIKRDFEIANLLKKNGVSFHSHKDQVIFEEKEIVKEDGTPYTIYTPYKNKWMEAFTKLSFNKKIAVDWNKFYQSQLKMPSLKEIGFVKSSISVKKFDHTVLDDYSSTRNFPAYSTSHIGPHLRFGTISIRQLIASLGSKHQTFLQELVWREFFMQILFHFPHIVEQNFKPQYNGIQWRNNEAEFKKWCDGQTGYPLVDAGMRELNETGFMHNRVRMVTASFLCKHLLIDWRWGEAYFARKLLDYELSSNNGNWQWAAGTGCDAAPYFRIFNPTIQLKKFDKDLEYVKRWVPEYDSLNYVPPMVNHEAARARTLKAYNKALKPDVV